MDLLSSGSKTIKDLSYLERPREKALSIGIKQLSNKELLAILLGTGMRGKDVVTYARDLLSAFDGIGGMLAAPSAA